MKNKMKNTMKNKTKNKTRQDYEDAILKVVMEEFTAKDAEKLQEELKEEAKKQGANPTEQQVEALSKHLDKAYRKQIVKENILNPRRNLKKVAVIAILVAGSMTVCIMSVEAFRIRMYKMFSNNQSSKYVGVRIIEEEPTTTTEVIKEQEYSDEIVPQELEGKYALTWLPEGYTFDKKSKIDLIDKLQYKKNPNNVIVFSIKDKITNLLDVEENLEKEGVNECITINGKEAILNTKEEIKTLYWNYENSLFILVINDVNISRENIIKMAENAKYIQ